MSALDDADIAEIPFIEVFWPQAHCLAKELDCPVIEAVKVVVLSHIMDKLVTLAETNETVARRQGPLPWD